MVKLIVLSKKTFAKLRKALFLEQPYGCDRLKTPTAICRLHKLFLDKSFRLLNVVCGLKVSNSLRGPMHACPYRLVDIRMEAKIYLGLTCHESIVAGEVFHYF